MTVPQEMKHRITLGRSNSASAIYPSELKAGLQAGICTPVLTVALFKIAKR